MFECKIGRETLYFSIENARGELDRVTSVARRGCGFAFSWSDHGRIDSRIMVGSWSDHSRIMVGSAPKSCSVIFRGRRSIW